jgi:hypothetical protein
MFGEPGPYLARMGPDFRPAPGAPAPGYSQIRRRPLPQPLEHVQRRDLVSR